MRVFGRKRAAAMAVVFAALAAAPVANAAVMQQRPASSYQANGTVRKIIVVGNTAYLGGDFTAMIPSGGGTAFTRNHAAAVDMTTGALLPWNPNVNGTVRALLASGGNVYLGGSFTTVGGAAHKNMVEVDGTTGAPIAAFANTTRPNKMVRAFVQIGNSLYVGKTFTNPRSFLMEVNATTTRTSRRGRPSSTARCTRSPPTPPARASSRADSSSAPSGPAVTAVSPSAP